MKCGACGRRNDDDAKFCDRCKAPLSLEKKAPRPRPQGALAFLYDGDSVRLSSTNLAALGAERAFTMVAAVLSASFVGTGAALTVRYSLLVAAIAGLFFLFLGALILGVVHLVQPRFREAHIARIKRARGAGRPIAAWSQAFIAINAVLALGLSAVLTLLR